MTDTRVISEDQDKMIFGPTKTRNTPSFLMLRRLEVDIKSINPDYNPDIIRAQCNPIEPIQINR